MEQFLIFYIYFFLLLGTDGTTTLGDAWWLRFEDISLPETSDLVTLSDLEQQLAVQGGSGGVPVGPLAGVNGSYWAGLPTQLQTVVPQLANTALTTLKGRLGYTAGAGQGADATTSSTATTTFPNGFLVSVGDAVDDEALLALGRSFLGVDTTREELVLAAREYFASVLPSELKLGSLPTLLKDYRRVARSGWAAILETLGPEALFRPDAVMFSGRYMHWEAEDIRMKDVQLVLDDYRGLLAAAAARDGGDVGEEEEVNETEEDSFIAGPPPSAQPHPEEQQKHITETAPQM